MKNYKQGVTSRTLITSILIILLYFAWPYFSNSVLEFFKIEGGTKTIIAFLSNFLLLAIIIFVYSDSLKKDFKSLRKNFKKYMLKGLKYFLIGLGGFVAINAAIAIIFEYSSITNDNLTSLESIFDKTPFLFILTSLFYYPVIEEIVFKKTFKDIINNKLAFVFISSFTNAFFTYIFSFQNPLTLIYIIPLTIFLMGFAYAYYETDNLLVPIIYRILYNVIPNIAILIEVLIILN